MAKPKNIELAEGDIVIPILYEDRSVLALDKPPGWMLAPDSWDRTGRNLQLALQSSLNAGDYWATSRNLKYLRFVHRLDAWTTGITLFAKSAGALKAYSELFEDRRVEKIYLAAVRGIPSQTEWTCSLAIEPDPDHRGQMRTVRTNRPLTGDEDDETSARSAETRFRVLETAAGNALIEARPITGRTHQIRVHLAHAGHPVLGDPLYGPPVTAALRENPALGLRAVQLSYRDPFQRWPVRIEAPVAEFTRHYGFKMQRRGPEKEKPKPEAVPKPSADTGESGTRK